MLVTMIALWINGLIKFAIFSIVSMVGKKHPSKIIQAMLLKVNEMYNVTAQWQSEFTGIIYTDTGTICQKIWSINVLTSNWAYQMECIQSSYLWVSSTHRKLKNMVMSSYWFSSYKFLLLCKSKFEVSSLKGVWIEKLMCIPTPILTPWIIKWINGLQLW